MDADTAIETVRQVIACDNARDSEGYRALLHPEYQSYVHGNPGTSGPEEETAAIQQWWTAMADVHLQELDIYAVGDKVALRYTLEGTNSGEFYGRPASGKPFKVENCTLFLIEEHEGRNVVRNAWRYSDTLGLTTQLGLLPRG